MGLSFLFSIGLIGMAKVILIGNVVTLSIYRCESSLLYTGRFLKTHAHRLSHYQICGLWISAMVILGVHMTQQRG
jgi:hypothetical protein